MEPGGHGCTSWGGGVFGLLAREFAPLAERLASVSGRLGAGIPAVLDPAARRGPFDRHWAASRAKFHVETALKQLDGVAELADDAIGQAEGPRRPTDPEAAAVLPRLRNEKAAASAKAALTAFEAHLRDDVLPRSEGEGRLGPDLFARKMRFTTRSWTI